MEKGYGKHLYPFLFLKDLKKEVEWDKIKTKEDEGMQMLRIILDLLFPPHCAFCGVLLKPGSNEGICADCRSSLSFCATKHCCEKCGKPIDLPYALCRHCKRYEVQNFDRICSVLVYEGKAKDGIVAFKGNSLVESGVVFAELMADMVKHTYANLPFDGVVAVPPRRKRMREKHFDQAGFLAEHVAKGLHIPYLRRMLYQKENRKKQSELDFMARFENVNENFVVRKPMLVSGKTILVIDDVCTSRATLNECARALKMAGAKEVYCATVATTA